jgi:hypothetical protein
MYLQIYVWLAPLSLSLPTFPWSAKDSLNHTTPNSAAAVAERTKNHSVAQKGTVYRHLPSIPPSAFLG